MGTGQSEQRITLNGGTLLARSNSLTPFSPEGMDKATAILPEFCKACIQGTSRVRGLHRVNELC
ncbi:hypothetical protein PHLCEN_2v7531 [Hermanssonia centrifuga]|uniref:Uncharacterized protein n=1 Tax=Hermanssonia centrifuga TaxID=98765 RepID=A0A2R6NWC3_9APHY|nr:hypothetical protein PHLCEN_2v7531 [Hermanssonia centrifuga]